MVLLYLFTNVATLHLLPAILALILLFVTATFVVPTSASTLSSIMGRRQNHKIARRKEAKRQRLADRRAASSRKDDLPPDSATPQSARSRLTVLRDAVLRGDAPAPRGLINLGNTCYFNSVLQNLARVSLFRDYFVGGAALPEEGSMTTAFRSFLIAMCDIQSRSSLDLSTLLDNVARVNSSFSGRAQHDAHELMRVVFDGIVEEEKKRLANVARGVCADTPIPVVDHPDDESVNSQSSSSDEASVDKSMSDNETESTPLKATNFDASSSSDGHDDLPELPNVIHLPSPPSPSLVLGNQFDSPSDQSPDDTEADKIVSGQNEDAHAASVPPEKLVTIVEKAFGGLLSSTIRCTECGYRSSVDEPFFDLQLPLVAKDGSDSGRDGDCDGKRKSFKRGKSNSVEPTVSEQTTSSSTSLSVPVIPSDARITPEEPFIGPIGPPAPPPPPPLPPLPRTVTVVPTQTSTEFNDGSQKQSSHCDVMAELRDRTDLRERAEAGLNSIASGGNDSLLGIPGSCSPPEPPNGDTASAFGDDEDDVDGIQSLFDDSDTENNTPSDAILADIGGMTAYSTGKVAHADEEAPKSPETPPAFKKTVSNSSRRGGSIFSFLNGFGGSGTAPHGYRSLISSLEEFTKVEVLEGDNAYGCEECTRRKKLRLALEQRKEGEIERKKETGNDGSSSLDKSVSGSVSADVRESNQDDGMRPPQTRSSDSSHSTSSESKATDSEEQVLMSSPVTSSESSSGVSSEDDGEIATHGSVKRHCVSAPMTRDEEDAVVKELKVKVPVVRTRAEKRMMIKNPPQVLAIQLKRFSQLGYRGRLGKMTGHVEFGLKLDLSNFVSRDFATDEGNRKEIGGIEYILTGITVHCGSLSGGHYVSYVSDGVLDENRGAWYLCDDSRISKSSVKDVLGSEAYLLFYERIDNNLDANNI